MITLKITALVLGAGTLFSLFAPEFDADLLLAIVACFSQDRSTEKPAG